MSRRFVLTYTREGHSMEVEGVLFSTGGVAVDPYPDDGYPCPRGFINLASMDYSINEFGDTSLTWLDEEEEEKETPPNWTAGPYLAPPEAINTVVEGITLLKIPREKHHD